METSGKIPRATTQTFNVSMVMTLLSRTHQTLLRLWEGGTCSFMRLWNHVSGCWMQLNPSAVKISVPVTTHWHIFNRRVFTQPFPKEMTNFENVFVFRPKVPMVSICARSLGLGANSCARFVTDCCTGLEGKSDLSMRENVLLEGWQSTGTEMLWRFLWRVKIQLDRILWNLLQVNLL